MEHKGGGLRVVLVALGINLLIALFKFITAAISASTAMLAEALHSLADTGNQLFLLIGMRRSQRAPDQHHPFGYGSETYFWSFMAAGSIFLIGSVVSIREGIDRLWSIHAGHGVPHGSIRWAVLVLVVSLGLELISLRSAMHEFRHLTAGRGVRQALKDVRDPTVLTVLFEDLAALFGLLVALSGVLLSHYTGRPEWDAGASIVVGVALAAVAVILGRDSKGLLLGKAVPPEDHDRIVQIAASSPHVAEVIHLRTIHMGPQDVLCALKVRFDPELNVGALEASINEIEMRLRHEMPKLRRIYIEPGFDEERLRRARGELY